MNKVLPNGVINIDKPSGVTSHDVVDVLRKVFRDVKIGHNGTLDPMATGVMAILVGEATKLSDVLTSENKIYKVKMLLGVETNTYDVTGKIMFASVVNKDEIYIKERIKRFIGKQLQTPPIYSAIRVEGKRAYEYAREGKEVNITPREIEIFKISNINVNLELKEVEFIVSCSKGTYIRTLVNDIGKKLGCGATMSELTRIKNGNFDIKDSVKLQEYIKYDIEKMIQYIIPIKKVFKENKIVNLNDEETNKFINGVKLKSKLSDQIVKVYNSDKYIGLGNIKDNILKRYIIE